MKVFVVLVVLSAIVMSSMAFNVGGIGDTEKVPGDKENAIVQRVAPELKGMALANLAGSDGTANQSEFDSSPVEILGFKTQTVAGTNYFFKLRIAKMVFHARVYRDLKDNVSVVKVIGPKAESDPINYFE